MSPPDHVQVFLRRDGNWAWRRVASNGQVIASDAGQGYRAKRDCLAMAAKLNPDVEVKVVPSERFTEPPDG